VTVSRGVADDIMSDSPFDPSIPVIRTGSPEFTALAHAMNKAV